MSRGGHLPSYLENRVGPHAVAKVVSIFFTIFDTKYSMIVVRLVLSPIDPHITVRVYFYNINHYSMDISIEPQ